MSTQRKLSRTQQKEVKTAIARANRTDKKELSAQDSIPYLQIRVDGICQVTPTHFTKTIQFRDINYQLSDNEDKQAIFDGWCDFLNYFDSSIKFQFSFVNLTALRESFARAIPLRSDQFESIQRELSKIIEVQQAKGNNGIVKTKYLTFGIDADNIRSAKHFTEDLLLSSMETAGAKDMPEDAERKGLGTPATRAGILEKLVSTGMLERRKVKKQTILVPTALGNSLITVLPEQLQSPLLTAEWENRLSQVQKGELEPEEFLDGIRGMLTDLVKDYRPVSGADILFPSAEKTVGKCPRCGRPVIERSKGYFCTGQDCKFVLWRDSRFFTLKQKALDRKTAQLLLEKGRAPLKGCVSSKTGKVYDAAVVLEDDGERAHFKLVFGNG